MFNFGAWEIAIVALVVILLFGTKRLPELGSGLGKAISNFKKGYQDSKAIDVTPDKEEPTPAHEKEKISREKEKD